MLENHRELWKMEKKRWKTSENNWKIDENCWTNNEKARNPGKIFEPWKIDENSTAHLRLMEPGKDQRSFSGNATDHLQQN